MEIIGLLLAVVIIGFALYKGLTQSSFVVFLLYLIIGIYLAVCTHHLFTTGEFVFFDYL